MFFSRLIKFNFKYGAVNMTTALCSYYFTEASTLYITIFYVTVEANQLSNRGIKLIKTSTIYPFYNLKLAAGIYTAPLPSFSRLHKIRLKHKTSIKLCLSFIPYLENGWGWLESWTWRTKPLTNKFFLYKSSSHSKRKLFCIFC